MLKRRVACLSLGLVASLVSLPLRTAAQTNTPPAAAADARREKAPQASPEPTLGRAFAEAAAVRNAGALTTAEIKKLEKLNLQSTTNSQGGYTKGQKVLVISIVAGLVVLAVVLALTTEKGGHSFCDIDPGDPDCIGPR